MNFLKLAVCLMAYFCLCVGSLGAAAGLSDDEIIEDVWVWIREPDKRDGITEKFQANADILVPRFLEYLSRAGSTNRAAYASDEERAKIIETRRHRAGFGFRILGESAAEAVPALDALMGTNHWAGRKFVGVALTGLGPKAGPAVRTHIERDLQAPLSDQRFTAVGMLLKVAVEEPPSAFTAEETTGLLASRLNDDSEPVRQTAIFGLGLMRHRHEKAATILRDLIDNPKARPEDRTRARISLEHDHRPGVSPKFAPKGPKGSLGIIRAS